MLKQVWEFVLCSDVVRVIDRVILNSAGFTKKAIKSLQRFHMGVTQQRIGE